MTIKEKLIYTIIFLLITTYLFKNYKHPDLHDLIIAIVTFFVLSFTLDMRFWRNKDRPLFEIKDDILFYKNHWGSIREYPLTKLKGKVETSKILYLEEHLKTPKITDYKDSLYIGILDKKERSAFLCYLKREIDLMGNNIKTP